MGSTYYYWDKEERKLKEGFPPNPNIRYGDAPYIITDTIDPYYHPGAGMYVESKKALYDMDKATGCITTDKLIPATGEAIKEKKKAHRQDLHNALHKSIAQLKSGTAPLTEERKAAIKKNDEIIAHAKRNGVELATGVIRAEMPKNGE